jgi:class 3 adenylate cyclase
MQSVQDRKASANDEIIVQIKNDLLKAQTELSHLKKHLPEFKKEVPTKNEQRKQAEKISEIEFSENGEKIKQILQQAFPPHVADAVLHGRKVLPVSKDCVSVVFTDIVGFTALSGTMDAGKVASMLTRLFDALDALAAEHGVQKVDVIGDAYLAAANLFEDQAGDHAARAARFAVAAVAAARAIPIDADDPAGGPRVELRAGMHCGPAAAVLLGSWGGLKFTLVGDTVNVASRMESTSAAGRVQCSEAAAGLVGRQAPGLGVEARAGGVDVKGKGRMQTYWIGPAAVREGPAYRFEEDLALTFEDFLNI